MDGHWTWTNTDNGNTLFATTNGTGAANSIIRVTDQSLMGSLNIIYTAPAGTTVMGLAFVPVPTPYVAALIYYILRQL